MRTFFLCLISVFLFIGCSSKEEVYHDLLHEQAITKSKTVQLRVKNKIQAYVVATYINQIDHELIDNSTQEERFIVSVYASEKIDKTIFDELLFKVNNSQTPSEDEVKEEQNIEVVELKKADPLVKLMPSSNSWVRYFYIKVPKIETERLTLTITTENFGSGSVSFIKYNL